MREGAGGVEFLDVTSTGKEPVSREGGEETTTLGSKLGGDGGRRGAASIGGATGVVGGDSGPGCAVVFRIGDEK